MADALPLTIGGHKGFGVARLSEYRLCNDTNVGIAVQGQSEGFFMVSSSLLNEKCRFDFGNAETNNLDNQAGHMDAINITCHDNEFGTDAHGISEINLTASVMFGRSMRREVRCFCREVFFVRGPAPTGLLIL